MRKFAVTLKGFGMTSVMIIRATSEKEAIKQALRSKQVSVKVEERE